MTQSLLKRQYQATLAKYRKFTKRLNKRIRNNTLEELSRRKRNQLLRTVERLRRRIESLQLSLKHAGVAVGMGLAMTLATPAAAQQPFPIGQEFLVPDNTGMNQTEADIAMDPDGNYVMVWSDGNISGISGRRFNALGEAQGGNFTVNTGGGSGPAVAMDLDGDFVVTWTEFESGYDFEVKARRYSSDGTAQGSEFRVNTYTTSGQRNSDVAMDDAGNFVISWESQGQDSYTAGTYGQRYDASGIAQGLEFRASAAGVAYGQTPTVAMDSDGDFVIVWTASDGYLNGIQAQRYNSAGTAQGSRFFINSTTSSNQERPSVAMDPDGNFVVSFDSYYAPDFRDIRARRFQADGTALGNDFIVNTSYQTSWQTRSAISVDSDGDFVIAWQSLNQDGSSYGIYTKRYAPDGTPYSNEILVNTTTQNFQQQPAVASDADGEFVVVFESYEPGGEDLYAQRFSVVPPPTVIGSEFQVNTYTTAAQQKSVVAMDDSGDYIIAWFGYYYSMPPPGGNNIFTQAFYANGQPKGSEVFVNSSITNINTNGNVAIAADSDGDFVIIWETDYNDIYGQRFNKDGTKSGSDFLVSDNFYTQNQAPSVAMDAGGDFVVTWEAYIGGAGSQFRDILAKKYNADGTEAIPEFTVNTTTVEHQWDPFVAMDDDGDFVILWEHYYPVFIDYDIFGQRFDALGVKQGSEFEITDTNSEDERIPGVAMDANGNFVATWQSSYDGQGSGIFFQRFDASGVAQGSQFLANTETYDQQRFPSIAMSNDGDFVITWNSANQDGDSYGIYAQKFDNTGKFEGPEFRANTFTTNSQRFPSVGMDADGDFVITWQSFDQSGSGSNLDIFAKQYSVQPDPATSVEEFQVNTFTTNNQGRADVAADSDGDFVVVWQSYLQSGGLNNDIYGQRYFADGTPDGTEFLIKEDVDRNIQDPAVAMDRVGNFVVVWESDGQDLSGYGIFGQLYNADGTANGSEFAVNLTTLNDQQNPSVAMDDDGDFVVVWEDYFKNLILGQGFNNSGTKVGPTEFQVNTSDTYIQVNPSVAMDTDGDIVVVWQSYISVPEQFEIRAQGFMSDGTPVGTEFAVNTYTTGNQGEPQVSMSDDGNFVVAWSSGGQDSGTTGIYAQFFDSSGTPMGGEYRVNDYFTGTQEIPDVMMDADGDFVVVWESYFQDGDLEGIFGKRFNASGQPQGSEFQVNAYTTNNQRRPAIALDNDGDYIVAWQSTYQDGSGGGIFAKIFDSDNPSPPPELVTNAGVTLDEEATQALNNTHLEYSDADQLINEIKFEVTALPQFGDLTKNGTPMTIGETFSQAGITTGNVIRYIHDGSENFSDTFRFTITDGNTTLAEETFNMTINPINDPPSLDMNISLDATEGSTATIMSPENLFVTDPDNVDADLRFQITTVPAFGTLQLNGGQLDEGTEFTHADLIADAVTYVNDGTENTSDSFNFILTDGSIGLPEETFSIVITTVDDPPVLNINAGVTVNEGETVTLISPDHLETTDEESSSDDIVYTVTTFPVTGSLLLDAQVMGSGGVATFTQTDLTTTSLEYQHDGSETDADSFTFDVSDGTNTQVDNIFAINVSPVDDPPVLDINLGVVLDEGATITITNNDLAASDPDGSVDNTTTTFTLTAIPAFGVLSNGSTALGEGDTFSQADVDESVLTYEHDGTENFSDAFSFTITDGVNTTNENDFIITINSLNDAPVEEANTGAIVAEGGTVTLLVSQLSYSDLDNTDAEIIYEVNAPTNGTLFIGTTALSDGDSFTQQDIVSGLISYTHDGTNTTSDSFTFGVSNALNTGVGSMTFNFTINSMDGPPQVTTNTGITVDEGFSEIIGFSELAADDENTPDQVTFTITSFPANGVILRSGSALTTAVPTFTQENINLNEVAYEHDGEETTSDSFSFTVTDGNQTSSEATVDITINPVNDPPVLVRNNALLLPAVDESGPFTTDNLQFTDPDNFDSQIIYTLTGLPTNGTVGTVDTNFGLNATWSQDDIDNQAIGYFLNEGSEATSDSFDFSVTDGTATPITGTFQITITRDGGGTNNPPTAIALSNNTIQESSPAGFLVGNLVTADVDAGDAHTYIIGPGSDKFEIQNTNKLHIINPLTAGSHDVTIESSDGTDAIERTFTITVIPEVNAGDLSGQGVVNFGTTTENFRMISVPAQSTRVNQVFTALNAGDFGDTWKVVEWLTSGSPRDLNASSSLAGGKGYWFLSITETTIVLPPGNPVSLNPAGQFVYTLSAGWNIIGNPFLKELDWSTKTVTQGALLNDGLVHRFRGTYSTQNQTLNIFEGAFVNVDAGGATIAVRSPTLQSPSGRPAGEEISQNYYANGADWRLQLRVESDRYLTDLSGVGMHPDGTGTADRFDISVPPTIGGNGIFRLTDKETGLARNLVSEASDHLWNFDFVTNEPNTRLTWNNSVVQQLDRPLYLLIPSRNQFVDMSKENTVFLDNQVKEIQVVYGQPGYELIRGLYTNLYPNPTDGDVELEILNFESDNDNLEFDLFSLDGKTKFNTTLQPVNGKISLSLRNLGLPSAVYLYRIKTRKYSTIPQKLIIRDQN